MENLTSEQVEIIKDQIGESVSYGSMYPNVARTLVEILEAAINYTHCCEELLCVKEDVDGLTAGKYYVELHKDKTHTKVVDDYGIETMYFSDRFVKPPKQ
mgnify:CR=1 FL=1